MNYIEELIEKARIELHREGHTDVVIDNLLKAVRVEHKKQIVSAFNRGQASMMGAFMMSADQFYTKYYEEN
jgi:hypothetical protein